MSKSARTLLIPLLTALCALPAATPVSAQVGPCVQRLQSRVDAAPAGATIDVPACAYHETVFLRRAITLDGHNQAIVDGDNVRDRWFWIGSSDVTIKNFSMRNAASASQEGAIGTAAGTRNIVIDHNDLGATSNGSPIAIGETTDSKVINNQIHGGGQMGISTWRNTNLTISGNHVWNNNTAGVDPYWAAGGIKAVQDQGVTISGNEVDHNIGPGIWIDILATGVVIANNNVHDQEWNPIFFEVSSGGDIYGNTVSASPNGAGNWGCIVASSSANVRIHDNTCIDTLPLRAQLDNRPDVPAGAGRNNVIQNNRLIRPNPPQATSWWQWDPSGPLVPGRNGNVDTGNVLGQLAPTLIPTSVPTRIPTTAPTTTATLTSTPAPVADCEVNIKINGVERGWVRC